MGEPFQIAVSDEAIKQLKDKLATAALPDELDLAGWSMGTPLSDIRRMLAYWMDEYDWREAEANLNKLPQYRTNIDVDGFGTLKIHYVHERSFVTGAIPLLVCHGFPGSFLEVKKLLPLLTNPDNEGEAAFRVVPPSLPNFAFSD